MAGSSRQAGSETERNIEIGASHQVMPQHKVMGLYGTAREIKEGPVVNVCRGCQHAAWCERWGCTAFNPQSRWRFDELRRRSKENNDLMDEIEAALLNNSK